MRHTGMNWQRVLAWVAVILAIGACSDPGGVQVGDTGGAPVTTSSVPNVGVVSGVMVVAPGAAVASSQGSQVVLERCLLASPGLLRFAGTITTSDNFVPGQVGLVALLTSRTSSQGDATVSSWHLEADVVGSGAFSFSVPRWDPERMPHHGPFYVIDPEMDLIAACSLHAGPGLPPSLGSVTLEIGDLADREEPAGSLQALGAGAILGDLTDPRLVYAYLASLEWELPFERVWAPDPDSGVVVRRLSDYRDRTEPCPRMHLDVATGTGWVLVAQTEGCLPGSSGGSLGASSVDTGEPVPGSEGFTWWDSEGETFAAMVDGDYVVTVGGDNRPAVAETAAALHAYANTHVRALPDNPLFAPDIDVLLERVLRQRNLVERARFDYRDIQKVIVVHSQSEPPATIGYLVAEMTSRGWTLAGTEGMRESAWSSCVDGMGAGDGVGGFHFFATQNSDWVLDMNDGTGWQQAPTTNGVAFFPFGPDQELISHMLNTEFRVVNTDGSPIPGC